MVARGLLAVLACLPLAACGGDGPYTGDGAPASSGTVAPIASSTPEPTQSGPPQLRSSISGSCRITATGAEIRVEYGATAVGSTQLTRVRLLQDGREIEDSGPLEQIRFTRVATLQVQPGEEHVYRVTAEALGARSGNVQSTVRCGRLPTPSPGPRA